MTATTTQKHLINPYSRENESLCALLAGMQHSIVTEQADKPVRAIACYRHANTQALLTVDYSASSMGFEQMDRAIRQGLDLGPEWRFILSWRESAPF